MVAASKRILTLAKPEGPKDVAVRAAKSFVNGALAALTFGALLDISLLQGALIAGGTAAWSVVQNSLLAWSKS